MNKSNTGDDTTDGLLPVLISPSLLENFDTFIEDEGGLISFVDTEEEVGEVKFTDLGGLEETLSEFGNPFSVLSGNSLL